jgi:hypothetical protein
MSRLSSLIELRDKVRVGNRSGSLKWTPLQGHGELYQGCLNGSLDAADALHEIVVSNYGKQIFQWDGNAIVEI